MRLDLLDKWSGRSLPVSDFGIFATISSVVTYLVSADILDRWRAQPYLSVRIEIRCERLRSILSR
jgi:hypothetical protein